MKKILRRMFITLAILLPVAVCLFLASPLIIDSYILPKLMNSTTTTLDKSASISRLTPFSVRGTLRFEHNGRPVISAPYMELTYSPTFLFSRKLLSLRLDHATIHITKANNSFTLQGFQQPADQRKNHSQPFLLAPIPVSLEKLILKECAVVIHEKGVPDKRFTTSSELKLTFTKSPDKSRIPESISGSFILTDKISGKGNISFTLGQQKHNAELSIETGALPIDDLLPTFSGLVLSTTAIKARAVCSINAESFSLTDMKLSGLIEQFTGTINTIAIEGAGKNAALPFSFSGSSEKFHYSVGPAEMKLPFAITVDLSGSGSLEPDGAATKGTVTINSSPDAPQTLSSPFNLPLDYNGSYTVKDGWKTGFSAHSDANTFSPGTALTGVIPAFSIEGSFRGDQSGIKGQTLLNTKPFSIIYNESKLVFGNTTLKASLDVEKSNTKLTLLATSPHISYPAKKLDLTGVRLELPVGLPLTTAESKTKGIFSVKEIKLQETILATFFSIISQKQEKYSLSGSFKSDFLVDSGVSFTGEIDPFQKTASIFWQMAATTISSSELPEFLTIPADLNFDGSIATNGNLTYQNNRLLGEVQATLSDGSLELSEKETSVKGINCSLELPRLPEILSSPGQRCTIDEINFGAIHLSNAGIFFRLDNPETIFIEKSKVSWCQGSVESTSLNFSITERELDTTLYCSKINFADLLNQFGLDQADGEGSVNGKLPIQFSKKGLHFDDGFLFSTPGTGGIVKFSNTEILRQGIGAVNAGGYLEYSMKAMEDFSYNWTKLSFNSSGDELILAMQLDGKPRTPLPYKFNNGMIVETAQEEGLQYPIRLDVNFRLPLADIFQIGQNIQSIKENM